MAATVGLMMTRVMGAGDDVAWLRAADLGVAMQLTNIARDVGEDGRRGRVYLPEELLAGLHSSQEEVLALCHQGAPPPPGVRLAVREVLRRAEAHYAAADAGIPLLPRRCQLAIRSARLIYAAIGDRVVKRDLDSITGRAVVPLSGKLWQVARALLWRRRPREMQEGPADALLLGLCGEVGLASPTLPC